MSCCNFSKGSRFWKLIGRLIQTQTDCRKVGWLPEVLMISIKSSITERAPSQYCAFSSLPWQQKVTGQFETDNRSQSTIVKVHKYCHKRISVKQAYHGIHRLVLALVSGVGLWSRMRYGKRLPWLASTDFCTKDDQSL